MAIKYEKLNEEIATIYEEVNLQVAYDTKQVTIGKIVFTWGLYIVTNALAIVLCLLVSTVAVLAIFDVMLCAENLLSVFSFVQMHPIVTTLIGCAVLVVAIRMVARHTMRTENIDIEKEVVYT